MAEGLAPENSPHIKQKEMIVQPLEISSEPERLGQVDFDDMTKKTNFVRSYFYFEWKDFLFYSRQQPHFGIRELLLAVYTWEVWPLAKRRNSWQL